MNIGSELQALPQEVFTRATKAILFVDVVGSVRLIDTDEEGAIRRWLDLVARIEQRILPDIGGRLVKQMGDGLLIEFDSVTDAVRVAVACLRETDKLNEGLVRDSRMELRMGLHAGEVIVSSGADVFGRDVNIASRIMSIAGAGEIFTTVEVRDAAAGMVDVDFVDMGDCHVRNLPHPLRAFRIVPPGDHARILPVLSEEDLLPTIAVIPPYSRQESDRQGVIGDLLAEEFIVTLAQSPELNVTSRLSTSTFVYGDVSLARIGHALSADFVLSGTYRGDIDRVILDLELAEVRSGRVVWGLRLDDSVNVLLYENAAIDAICTAVTEAIVDTEIRRARSQPLPTLENYALLMAAIGLMHRPSRRDFELAEQVLQTLIERTSDLPVVSALLARWHVLRVQQGWSDDPRREGEEALRLTGRALNADPTNVSALVSEGFVLTNLMHRLDEALDRYEAALDQSPSEALGRLLRGTLFAFRGEGTKAVRDTERALHLAPRDPHRYFFESLAASACIAAEDYERALALARQSLRSNRGHTSTLRVKAVAEYRLGEGDAARATVRELLRQQPDLTVSGWLRTAPSAEFEVGRNFARTLEEAGVPG